MVLSTYFLIFMISAMPLTFASSTKYSIRISVLTNFILTRFKTVQAERRKRNIIEKGY